VPDLDAVVGEARRLLRPGGRYLVQDRTAEDVRQPAGPRHPRGYLFEVFPRLLDVELARRPDAEVLAGLMRAAGLDVATRTVWELRAVHPERDAYLAEIAQRKGRSILHELDDDEIDRLVAALADRLPADEPVVETDRWTLWTGSLRS
jgi:SAM-dependent methyltransferase